jgi:hypothetical protein
MPMLAVIKKINMGGIFGGLLSLFEKLGNTIIIFFLRVLVGRKYQSNKYFDSIIGAISIGLPIDIYLSTKFSEVMFGFMIIFTVIVIILIGLDALLNRL